MKEDIDQDCPLCATPASFYFVSGGQLKYFECPNCTCFQISKSAEKALLGASQQIRQAFADQAKVAPEDHLFVIVVPDRHGAGETGAKVTGSFINKRELDL